MGVVLSQELEAFERELPMLMAQHEGQFAVVHGDRIVGFEPTYEAALEWAYGRFGLEPFMVRQVLAEQPVIYLTRHIAA